MTQENPKLSLENVNLYKVASPLYHQYPASAHESILEKGLRRKEFNNAGGENGPLRGIFLKERKALIPNLGNATEQVEIQLLNDTNILDITGEGPGSFEEIPAGVNLVGAQSHALVGWLERQGFVSLAKQYASAIHKSLYGKYEDLDTAWSTIENLLKSNNIHGVRFTEGYTEKIDDDLEFDISFPSIVIFDDTKIESLK